MSDAERMTDGIWRDDEGRRYEIVIGTDVCGPEARNGAFVEMWALDASDDLNLLSAFRWNATGKVTISMYRKDVPLGLLTDFLRVAGEVLSTDNWPLWGDLG